MTPKGWASNCTPSTDVHVVTSLADSGPGTLREACGFTTPRRIVFGVSGDMHLDNDIDVPSGTFIDGRGASVRLVSRGLVVAEADHVAISHLLITNASNDGIRIAKSDNVVVDHCTVTDCYDGLIDATHCRSGDKMRVSVQHCYLGKHNKGCAFGLGLRDPNDEGIRATFFENYFNYVNQRSPRLELGWAHVVNCFMRYGLVGSQSYGQGRLYLEKCWFKPYSGEETPVDNTYSGGSDGYVKASGCKTYSCDDPLQYKPEACERARNTIGMSIRTANDDNVTRLKDIAGWQATQLPEPVDPTWPAGPEPDPTPSPLTLEERVAALEQAVFG